MEKLNAKRLGELANKYNSKVAVGCAALQDAMMSDDEKLVKKVRKQLMRRQSLAATENAMRAEDLWIE